MKNAFHKENLLIILVLGLFGHNVYLQFQVEKAIEAAEYAASYATDAAEKANEAADYAEAASLSAEDAVYNAFGNQCGSCP